jgi:hypothetical protein
MGNPDLSNRTTTELRELMRQYVIDSPPYKAVIDELSKREKKVDESTSIRFYKTFFWSRLAGIAAIVAVVLAIIQIAIAVCPLIKTHEPVNSEMQQQAPNTQRSTKNKAFSSFSNTSQKNSISSKKTSTNDTPSKKTK